MNLAYDKRNLAGAVMELVRLAPERKSDGKALGREGRLMDLTRTDEAEDFLRYQAETLVSECIQGGGRPTLAWPVLAGVAFWSIDISVEPYFPHEGTGMMMPVDGNPPEYLVRFLKFLVA